MPLGGQPALTVTAANTGVAGNEIHVAVLHDNVGGGTDYQVLVRRYQGGAVITEERHDVSAVAANPTFADTVINAASALVQVTAVDGVRPDAIDIAGADPAQGAMTPLIDGSDGPPVAANAALVGPGGTALTLTAANVGAWGNALRVAVLHDNAGGGTTYDLVVREYEGTRIARAEVFRGLSTDQANARYGQTLINRESQLVTAVAVPDERPAAQGLPADATTIDQATMLPLQDGTDGAVPGTPAWDAGAQAAYEDVGDDTAGLDALTRIEPNIFNLLCLPAVAELPQAAAQAVYAAANTLCRDRRAMLLVDIAEAGNRRDLLAAWLTARGLTNLENAAVYFPRILVGDPLPDAAPTGTRSISTSGTIAGIMARTDKERGVWKAPAGTEAGVAGGTPTRILTDPQHGDLNILGYNALRSFPVYGSVVWGARTLAGADAAASEWKYVPVRRLALFLEESLRQGLTWVVFEPNDEPLWSQIRLNVEAFMQGLFLRGAFQGTMPRDAYYVLCDRSNNPQGNVDRGFVTIEIGFAPLKPAEFVILQFRQMAGQAQA